MAISMAALDTGQSSPTMNTSKCWHQQDSSYNNIIVLHEHNLMCAIKYPPLFVLFTSVVTRGFFIGGGSSIISRPYKVSPRNGDDGVMRRRLYTLRLSTRNWQRSRNPPIFIPRPTTPPTPSRGLAKYRRETTMTKWWEDGCTLYGCPRETEGDREIHQYLYLGPPPHQHHLAALQNIAARRR